MRSAAKHSTSILGGSSWTAFAWALVCALGIIATQPAHGQTYTVIHTFTGQGDGGLPSTGLTLGAGGSLYGTTSIGSLGYGSVFKLKQSGSGWILTPLYNFEGGSDGIGPQTRVAIAQDGTLYGATYQGGEGTCPGSGGNGCGTIFHLRPPSTAPRSVLAPWNETVLYRFTGGSDGGAPDGDITFDQSGSIYGTTSGGGSPSCLYGCGVIYNLTRSGGGWAETVLYSAQDGEDGALPHGGVVFDTSGNLYGAFQGCFLHCYGTVYELSPSGSGWTEQTLYRFTNGSDGNGPDGSVIIDGAGDLYGSSWDGGSGGGGVVFELIPSFGSWSFNLVYSLAGGGDSCGPNDRLLMDQAGNLYGTTYCDGTHGAGSVFKLIPGASGWTYIDLYDFTDGNDGGYPRSNVVLDGQGNLYGTASIGGTGHVGVVWEITP